MQQLQTKQTTFENLKHFEEGQEFWYARDIQKSLGYKTWQKFQESVESVLEELQFENLITLEGKLETLGTKSQPKTKVDYILSRLACYKLAMRGMTDECKRARTYFATQTRKQEIQETQTALSSPFELMQAMLNQMKAQQDQLDSQGQRIQALESKPSGTQVNITTIKDYKEFRKEELMEKYRRPIDALVHAKFKHISPELRWDFARRLYETEVGWIFPKVSKANEKQFEHFFKWLNESK